MQIKISALVWCQFMPLLVAIGLAATCSSQAADFTNYSAEFPSLAESTSTSAKGLNVNFTRTPEREPRYQWVGVLGWGPYGLFIPRKSEARSLADIQGESIGYLNGSNVQGVLQQAGVKKLEPVATGELNAKKLHLGRIDGWGVNLSTGPSIYLQNGFSLDELQVMPLNATWEQWLAASPNFPPQAAEQISAALTSLQRESVVKSLEIQYWQSIAGMPNPTVAKGK